MGFNFNGNGGYSDGFNNNNGNQSFEQLLRNYIGQTVIVFTTSGGASGCGFEGVLMDVNCKFIRVTNHQGTPPANPLSESICGTQFGDLDGGIGPRGRGGIGGNVGGIGGNIGCKPQYPVFTAGSVCDIPIDKIAAFCHNAV